MDAKRLCWLTLPPMCLQYNLDFRGLSPRGASCSPYRGSDVVDEVLGSSSAAASSATTASSDPNI